MGVGAWASRRFEKRKERQMKKTIVFDLDGCIETPYFKDEYRDHVEAWMKEHPCGYDFGQLICPLEFMGTSATHFFFNGAFELLRWVYDQGFEIAIFSNAVKERNDLLVPIIMERAFAAAGKEVGQFRYFSRPDCPCMDYMRDEKREKYLGFWYGTRKKPLAGLIVDKEDLPNTLLLDDDSSYAVRGEERNCVIGVYGVSPGEYLGNLGKDGRDYYDSTELGFHNPFYFCGLLKRAMAYAEQKGMSLVEGAYQAQYLDAGKELPDVEEWKANGKGRVYDETARKNWEIRHEGLVELRKYNPGLKFWSLTDGEARERYKDDIA